MRWGEREKAVLVEGGGGGLCWTSRWAGGAVVGNRRGWLHWTGCISSESVVGCLPTLAPIAPMISIRQRLCADARTAARTASFEAACQVQKQYS